MPGRLQRLKPVRLLVAVVALVVLAQGATSTEASPAGALWTRGQLDAIDCTPGGFCVAVGARTGTPAPQALAWGPGMTAVVEALPLPIDGTDVVIREVSCVSRAFCVAAGSYRRGSVLGTPIVVVRERGIWRLAQIPITEPPQLNSLSGVSCTSRSFCLAVGPRFGSRSTLFALAWDGKAWNDVSPAVAPPGARHGLRAVSCYADRQCMAVGLRSREGFPMRSFSTSFDKGEWFTKPLRLPPNLSEMVLVAVSCEDGRACTGAGWSVNSDGEEHGEALVVEWNGRTWHRVAAPQPGLNSQLLGLDEDGSGGVWSVGFFTTGDADPRTLVEHRQDGRWRKVPSPWPRNPPGTTVASVVLKAVAGVSANEAWAVGSHAASKGPSRTLLLRWDGKEWQRITRR